MKRMFAVRRRVTLGACALSLAVGAAGLAPQLAGAQTSQCTAQEALLQVYQQNLLNASGPDKAYWENQIGKLVSKMEQEGCI